MHGSSTHHIALHHQACTPHNLRPHTITPSFSHMQRNTQHAGSSENARVPTPLAPALVAVRNAQPHVQPVQDRGVIVLRPRGSYRPVLDSLQSHTYTHTRACEHRLHTHTPMLVSTDCTICLSEGTRGRARCLLPVCQKAGSYLAVSSKGGHHCFMRACL